MRHLTSLGILSMSLVVGCGGGVGTPKSDAAVSPDPDGDSTQDGSAPDTGSTALDADDEGVVSLGHCPAAPDVRGPEMALVRWADGIAFCIDSTEVTNADYAAFLAANVALTTQGARCGWNKAFAPETKSTNGPACPAFDPTARASYPVVCVDWCDADAYCRWSGKHLCQKPTGGSVSNLFSKDASEWIIACTGDGASKLPYGDVPTPGLCVDKQYPTTAPGLQPVKGAAMCKGGVPGLFDMSGNAWEWQDDCAQQSSDGSEDACSPLGGSFSETVSNATCTSGAPFFRKQVAGDAGFRCCVDAMFF